MSRMAVWKGNSRFIFVNGRLVIYISTICNALVYWMCKARNLREALFSLMPSDSRNSRKLELTRYIHHNALGLCFCVFSLSCTSYSEAACIFCNICPSAVRMGGYRMYMPRENPEDICQ